MTNRKKLTLSLSVFFIIMLIITIVSENIYYNNLPFVYTGFATKAYLKEDINVLGKIEYDFEENSYSSNFENIYINLLVDNEDFVEIGTALFSYLVEDLTVCKKNIEIDILELQKTNLALSEEIEDKEKDKYKDDEEIIDLEIIKLEYDLNVLSISDKEVELEKIDKLIENDGIVFAEQSGEVEILIEENQYVSYEQEIITILTDTGTKSVVWQMNYDQGNLFGVGDFVQATLNVIDEKSNESNSIYISNIVITEADFYAESQTFVFSGTIEDDVNINMLNHSNVSLLCTYKSDAEYDYVVPTTAIVFETSTSGYMYTVKERTMPYGTEYYSAKVNIEILYSLENETAISGAFVSEELIFQSSQEIEDGMTIKLQESE